MTPRRKEMRRAKIRRGGIVVKKDVETDGASACADHILPALGGIQLQQLLRGVGIPMHGGTKAVAAAGPGRPPAKEKGLGGEAGLPLQKKPLGGHIGQPALHA